MAEPCYIFDIDGTLANGDHRIHYITTEGQPKNWNAYFDACDGDATHPHVLRLCNDLSDRAKIIFVSGRSDRCRNQTVKWLADNLYWTESMVDEALYMRAEGDHKNDDELKIELLARVRADGYEPIMAFDDRNRVVKAWRAAGIPCAQVAEGDF
jgi:phosphoglycolate phosphatase-like HAD superfamily hydrolase